MTNLLQKCEKRRLLRDTLRRDRSMNGNEFHRQTTYSIKVEVVSSRSVVVYSYIGVY